MAAEAVQVAASRLAEDVAALFEAAGIDAGSARVVADDLINADLEGVASHGVMLVPMYLDRIAAGSVSREREGTVVSDQQAGVVLDGRNALGQVVARQAVAIATERAQRFGLGAVAVRNAFHFGAAGRYARMMAEAGAVGIVMSNTRPLMPAPGGAEAMTGNNPLAIAVPGAEGRPVEVDMALSASAMGKIRLAEAGGQPIPEGWAVDKSGRPTTDPGEAIRGMLLPAAGPKGFGLAFVIDLLCGGLSAGGVGDGVRPLYGDLAEAYNCSQFFLAIDVGHFQDPAEFAALAGERARRVSGSKRAPGVERVYAPGELAQATRLASGGSVRLSGATAASLRASAQKLNVSRAGLFGSEEHSA